MISAPSMILLIEHIAQSQQMILLFGSSALSDSLHKLVNQVVKGLLVLPHKLHELLLLDQLSHLLPNQLHIRTTLTQQDRPIVLHQPIFTRTVSSSFYI